MCHAPQYPTNAKAVGGNDVSMVIYYNYTGSGMEVRFQVSIKGTLVINVLQTFPSSATSGGSALYITERVTSPARDLPSFANMEFLNLRTYPAWNSTAATAWGNQPYLSIEMSRSGSYYAATCLSAQVLMFPTSPTPSSFYNVFCRNS